MSGQISISEYLSDRTYRRDGSLHPAPEWMKKERCENCMWWDIFPKENQPPDGWGIKGQCNCYHDPETMKNGYWVVNQTSYCNDFKEKEL